MLLPADHKSDPAVERRSAVRPRHAVFLLAACLLTALASLLSGAKAQAPGFADAAFETLWNRTDGLVASGGVLRPWVWGPEPGASLNEPFAGLPGGSHLVQFFDKGRMELNDPNADPADPFYVTNGRLAIELISGQAQTGLDSFLDLGTAQINLASDADDPTAPTYGSFNGVASIPGAPNNRRAEDLTGTVVRTAIDRQGQTQPWPEDHPDYGVRLVQYEDSTGHNIPDVFWNYLNEQADIIQDGSTVQGPLFYPWFAVTGFPISEPYWSYVKVEGKYTDVLIQAYERRVLTFVPHLPSPFKVQMGNIGQHYFEWRYGERPEPPPNPAVPTPTSPSLPAAAEVAIVGIEYRQSIVDINGTLCVISNLGSSPVSLAGWRLDSPKWGLVDTYRFGGNVMIPPGSSIRVHSGVGIDSATDIYMSRPTVMWDGMPYDYAVLYDNFGRQVADFFPAGDVGVPPTAPPDPNAPTATPDPNLPTQTPSGVGTPNPGDPTNTPQVPPPSDTREPTVAATGTANTTPSTTSTTTATATGTALTATPTRTAQAGCTELMRNGDFEAVMNNWFKRTVMDVALVTDDLPYQGTYSAYLADLNNVDDNLWQYVAIPGNVGNVTLTYWKRMQTEDTTGQDHDFMYTEIRDSNDQATLATLETITNRSTANVWENVSFSLNAYRGQTISLHFRSTTDATISSDFFVDNISMQACP